MEDICVLYANIEYHHSDFFMLVCSESGYTYNNDLKKRLATFASKHPDICKMTVDDKEFGSVTYEIQKSRISFRLVAPYSEERRKAASEYAKKNGIKQHKR